MPQALSPIKLAFVVNDAAFFLSHRRPLAEAVMRLGIQTTLIAPRRSDTDAELLALGINVEPWKISRRGTNIFSEISSLVDLVRILKKTKPDLIHNVTQKPVIYGSLAARLTGRPAVVNAISGLGYAFTDREGGVGLLKGIMVGMHRRSHGANRTRTIFQNPDDLASFVTQQIVSPSQARLIRGSGVDTALYVPAQQLPHEPVVTLPARMLGDKGVREAVGAALQLRSEGCEVDLQLAGGIDLGNPAAIPKEQLQEWVRSGSCKWLDHVVDMIPRLQKTRICCLPSYREGLPKALIEAASCGLPIITCDVPGCREVVRHGDNGLLVPPRDKAALASAIKTLLGDYDLCVRMGRRSRERAISEFGVGHVVQQHLDIYHELLGERWPQ